MCLADRIGPLLKPRLRKTSLNDFSNLELFSGIPKQMFWNLLGCPCLVERIHFDFTMSCVGVEAE